MKTGVSTSIIINTRKKKLKPITCDCKKCVNNGKKGCHYGWNPINGKCTRFGTNHCQISKEELQAIKDRNKLIKGQRSKREIGNTTLKMLSHATDVNVTKELLLSCTRYRNLGNGRFAIKCTNPENLMINVRSNKTLQRKSYRVIE